MIDLESCQVFREKPQPQPKMRRGCSDLYQCEMGNVTRLAVSSSCEMEELVLESEIIAAVKYSNIETVIMNPLCCGYLLQFCEGQHNSENVRFFLEVDEFRDMFAADKDKDIWLNDFEEIDNRVKYLEADDIRRISDIERPKSALRHGTWPSQSDKYAALKKIDIILNKYLNNDSSSQVCISDPLIEQTMKRINLLHLYGPEVFEEATREPIKTMKKDILPRFLASQIFRKMIVNVASCEPTPPPASQLKVPPPRSWMLTASTIDDFPESRVFQLDEIIHCMHLYNEFIAFLRKRVNSENLICVRMIDIYDGYTSTDEFQLAEAQAWKIYQYFVAPGSAFEVSIHHIHRKHVMLGMANPKPGMFDKMRHSVYGTLKVDFERYKLTDQYFKMGKMMREKKVDAMKMEGGEGMASMYSGCFGLQK